MACRRALNWLRSKCVRPNLDFKLFSAATAHPHVFQSKLRLEWLEDRCLLSVDLISAVNNPFEPGNGSSSSPSLSDNGRYVAFESTAGNLVPGDTNNAADVFVRDTLIGQTIRVSTDSTGNQGNAASSVARISGNGRYVAFQSSATNLVPDDTNGSADVFVKDILTGQTVRVSTDNAGNQANRSSAAPSITRDGRCVAFQSDATNLINGDTNNSTDVFVKDLVTARIACISMSSNAILGNGASSAPCINPDAHYVAFASDAANLVAGDTNSSTDVFAKDLASGRTDRVSTDSAGAQGNGRSSSVSINGDGRYVVFQSEASNLVSGDVNRTTDVFLKDRLTGLTYGVNSDSNGQQGNGAAGTPSISDSGRYVVFASTSTNLVHDDANQIADVFLKDMQTGQTFRMSADAAREANGTSSSPTVSGDGRYVAFQSEATNLNPVDSTANGDVYCVANRGVPGDVPGLYDPNSSTFYLRGDQRGGDAQHAFVYGVANLGWVELMGDWNSDGVDTPGLYDPRTSAFYLTNRLGPGDADYVFTFGIGAQGWKPLVGDWDGDGRDSIALYEPATSLFFFKNSLSAGDADEAVQFGMGSLGWIPIAGDWDGLPGDGFGFYEPATSLFFLKNARTSGPADEAFQFGVGSLGWVPLAGNWDGTPGDGVGFYLPDTGQFFLKNAHAPGAADASFTFGAGGQGWRPLVGAWAGLFPATTAATPAEAAAPLPVDQIDLASLAAQQLQVNVAGGDIDALFGTLEQDRQRSRQRR